MQKCIFLDRDGVINVDHVDYTYRIEDFKVIEGVVEALQELKSRGFLLVVITNQSGISKKIYGHQDVYKCHEYLQRQCNNLIDAFYYCPYHPVETDSLTRKPGSLMFEKAIARFNIDVKNSWMIGDKGRDLIPAKKLGIKTVLVGDAEEADADIKAKDLAEGVRIILNS